MNWRGGTPEGESSEAALFIVRLLRWVRGGFWLSIAAMLPGVLQAFREQDLARPVVVLVPLYLTVVLPATHIAMKAAARGDVSRESLVFQLDSLADLTKSAHPPRTLHRGRIGFAPCKQDGARTDGLGGRSVLIEPDLAGFVDLAAVGQSGGESFVVDSE